MNTNRSLNRLRNADSQPEPRYLVIGRILRPHGVRGELRVEMISEHPERWANLGTAYVGDAYRKYSVRGARIHRDVVLLTLEGCESRNEAELLRNQLVYVALEDAVPLDEGEHYIHQIVGLEVITDQDVNLGEVVDILSTPGANDILVIHGVRGEVLIPVIREAILDIDLEQGYITIHEMPGLLDN